MKYIISAPSKLKLLLPLTSIYFGGIVYIVLFVWVAIDIIWCSIQIIPSGNFFLFNEVKTVRNHLYSRETYLENVSSIHAHYFRVLASMENNEDYGLVLVF